VLDAFGQALGRRHVSQAHTHDDVVLHGGDLDVEHLEDRGQVFEVAVFAVHVEQRAHEGLDGLAELLGVLGLDAQEQLEVFGRREGEAGRDEGLDSFVVRRELEGEARAGGFGDLVSDFEVDELRDAFFAG
jgi:hypothetical protein